MIGFALEGGGAKGAYQAGAYIALTRNGIKPNMIAGTSIGSLNAALMAQGDIKKLVGLWENTTTDIFGINSKLIEDIKAKKITKNEIKNGYDNIKLLLKNKGIDTSAFLKVIKENIDEDKLRKSKMKFGLITVRVKDNKFEPLELLIDDIPQGKVAEYILASCYLPLFNYQPIIDNNYYIDGGFYNNVPLDLLEKKGCNLIYSIRIKGIGISRNKLKKETKVIEIKPKVNLGSIILFNKESNMKNMKLGFYDTLKVIKNLDGINYYFNHRKSKFYTRVVRNISKYDLDFLKIKYLAKNDQELVIKIVEKLLKDNNVDNLQVMNMRMTLFKLKRIMIKDKNLQKFISSCKLF